MHPCYIFCPGTCNHLGRGGCNVVQILHASISDQDKSDAYTLYYAKQEASAIGRCFQAASHKLSNNASQQTNLTCRSGLFPLLLTNILIQFQILPSPPKKTHTVISTLYNFNLGKMHYTRGFFPKAGAVHEFHTGHLPRLKYAATSGPLDRMETTPIPVTFIYLMFGESKMIFFLLFLLFSF